MNGPYKEANDRAAGLGRRIWMARASLNLTKTELAAKVKMTPKQIRKIEEGASLPGALTIIRLAIALDVSADYILGFERPKAWPPTPEGGER